MKVLIDIGHPGHVHYFKNLIWSLEKDGHELFVVARDRGVINELLDGYNIKFINRGTGRNSKIGKFIYMIEADIKLFFISLKIKPDLFLSFSSPYAAQVSSLLRIPSIVLNDTEHTDSMHSKFTYPFSTVIMTPNCYLNDLGKKHIRFNSVVENLYLNEKYYKPDDSIKKHLNIKNNEKYIVLRFVSWNAHHDFGQSGIDLETKRRLVGILKQKFRVFISSEGELDKEFEEYKINISPDLMHDVLANASLFIGESATMASESVLLNTPAVYINSLPLMGYLKMEQDAGLLFHFNSSKGVPEFVKGLIMDENLMTSAKERSVELQKNFIDPTRFLVWFIENYPLSIDILKIDEEFQNKFE